MTGSCWAKTLWMLWASMAIAFAQSTSPQEAYESAYFNVEEGDWWRDYNDDLGPYVANRQAYVLQSLAAMYRATGDPLYLDRLAYHVDGVLAQRNDARGVTDYRDESSPCWRETWYSNGGNYCWTLHSGIIIEGQLQFARLVATAQLGDTVAYDGVSFADKAAQYVTAAEETVAHHHEDWRDAGYYVLAEDTAPFLGGEAGTILPMNQSNAMGIPLLLLHELTGEAVYLERARALAARFYDGLVLMNWGGYAWTYYLDDLLDGGEDIAHASLSVRFAIACWRAGIIFDDTDMGRFAAIVDDVTVDDRTFWASLNGRTQTNYLDYQASLYEWLPLTVFDASIHTTVRNLFELSYPATAVDDGTRLNAWAQLAESMPPECSAFGVEGDWSSEADGWFVANTDTPQIEVRTDEDCTVPLVVDAESSVSIRQGETRLAANWQATDGALLRHLPVTAVEGSERFTLSLVKGAGLSLRGLEEAGMPDTGLVEDDSGTVRAGGSGDSPVGEPCPDPSARTRGCMTRSPNSMSWFLVAPFLVWRRRIRRTSILWLTSLGCVGSDRVQSERCTADSAEDREVRDTEIGVVVEDSGDVSEPEEAIPLRAISITAGKAHTCAILTDQTVRCWGSNASGQLDAPAGSFLQIEAGLHHTCGVTTAYELACWGWLDAVDEPSPTGAFVAGAGAYVHSAAIHTDGTIRAWGTESMLLTLREPEAVEVTDLSCGLEHCVVRDGVGTSHTWGGPYYAIGEQVGVVFTDVDAGYYHNCGVTEEGDLHCWGYDTSGQLDHPQTGEYLAVSCGGAHCCALDVEGMAVCWGEDHAGQSSPPEMAFASLSAGDQHSCGLAASGEVTCWGNDAQGQCTVPNAATSP